VFPAALLPTSRFVPFQKDEIEQSIPERFEKQVVQYPDRLAVKTKTKQLSYADFNQVANRLARAISGHRSQENEPVALLLDHDASAIVAIFGALKAGRSFVPLDPSLPLSRLKYMLDDSGAKLIVTESHCLRLAQGLLERFRGIIDLDEVDALAATDNLRLTISPADKCCILYTSGTTGKPKGVVHTHRNELHNVMHHTNSLFLSADDRLTLLGSYSTGQGMQDLYCALLNGATLYPWSLKTAGLTGLADWLIQEHITVYHSAATVYRYVIKQLSDAYQFPDLRIIRLGSESVSWKDVEMYKKHFADHCVFVNALSSSETKTIRQCILTKDTEVTGMVPVGYPVSDMDILVLDEEGNELGPNKTGEIAVRSPYLATGYWRSPELTRSSFQLCPNDVHARIFRTGEWGQMSADGCLAHFGRRDDRAKIRGYRIEIPEVELALLRNSAVDQVLVLCRENSRGDKYLIAYIVAARIPPPSVSELRAFLKQKIPDYMIPSVFIFLDSLPLTVNGKVDRNALPESSRARPALDNEFIAPRDPIEVALTRLWNEILEIDEIGVLDNHFDLGGNSLTAMQVCAHVGKQFGVAPSLPQFFESPTITGLSRAISTASGFAAIIRDVRLEPFPREANLPLSFAQQRLWFLDQWAPREAVYNVCEAHRVKGRLDEKLAEESLNEIVRRHEILRTTFSALNDQPFQTIAPQLRLKLALIDLRTFPEAERNDRSSIFAREEARRPFDLAHGPLLRLTLVRLAEDEHLLLITLHQIVCDGWSMQVFFREFWTVYQDLSEQRSPSLAPLTLQYGDFALWQHLRFQEGVLQPDFSFWLRELGGELPVLDLPTDRSRPALQTFQGSKVFLVLPRALTETLNELSRQEGVTLFMILLAAFKVLLYGYTGKEDLAVGFPVANRNWAETAKLIGLFINTLVARSRPSGNQSFRSFLFKVRDACLGAYAHQDLPFEKLVEVLRPLRDLSRNPIFQAMFMFQNMPLTYAVPPELCSTPISIDNGTSKVDLTLSLAQRDGQLIGFFEYSTDLFDRLTIERMAGHFQILLQGIVGDPNQAISSLPILSGAEHRQLSAEWNNTTADYPKHASIHDLFERQVARTPAAVAIEFDGQSLTYHELNSCANQVAHYLINLGIGRLNLAGICVERSLEMVVGLLGILKAGAAYVPLDPSYPRERLEFMLDDAQVSVLLTQEGLVKRRGWKSVLSQGEGTEEGKAQRSILDSRMKLVCLDRDWPIIAKQSVNDPKLRFDSETPAYVIYTSGSTGAPKGVCGLHRGAVNRFSWMWRGYPFHENEKSCIKTSLSFVDSVWEVFGPLLKGVPSVLISDETVRDLELFIRALSKDRVTRIVLVPSLLKTLLDAFPLLQDKLPQLKFWCSSGERLSSKLVHQFRQSMPDAMLVNLYGSTEVSGDATYYDFKFADPDIDVPIGRPISNTQIFILDSQRQLVPIGVPGELYVGGDALAQGYWKRPELTAESFIGNPFSAEAGARLYRTGDRARYWSDGNIEFLGRADNQVKIRGCRVELGEIEDALNRHPTVKESVVVAVDEGSSDSDNFKSKIGNLKSLLAYIVPVAVSPSVTELHNFLKEKLPEYMIPSSFVFLNGFPLTPNGKIDRSALPPPDGERPQFDQGFVEPRTEIEELIAQVWREVLKLDRIGVHDNFFELGGHSLLATRVVARLRRNFNVDLALRKLFELPTVAGLAQHIDYSRRSGSGTVNAPITPAPRDQRNLPSIGQESLLFLDELIPNTHLFNISAVYRLRGPLDLEIFARSLDCLIMRQEALRTTFPIMEGQRMPVVTDHLRADLSVVDLQLLSETEFESQAEKLVREEVMRPFDLRSGPLFRMSLLRHSKEHHVLVITVHHVISDAWSMVQFLKELGLHYECLLNGHPSSLKELSIQFADFACWQRQTVDGGGMQPQLAYWRKELGGSLVPLTFTGIPGPLKELSFRTGRKAVSITGQKLQALNRLSRAQDCTTFMTLLTTFKVLLYSYTNQEDIRVATLVANRSRDEVQELIGHFVNTIVLRTRVSADRTFTELQARVRETTLAGLNNDELPFESLLKDIESTRNLDRSAVAQVMLVHQSSPVCPIEIPGIAAEVIESYGLREQDNVTITSFDLILFLKERGDQVVGSLIYKSDLFGEVFVDQMLDRFHDILERACANPHVIVGELCDSLRSAGDRRLT
jgi:amino acid adenylation domain-containing protein